MKEKTSKLKQEVSTVLREQIKIWDGRRKRHGYTNNIFVFLGIALSAGITIAGIYHQATLAAILGTCMAAILTLQQVFPFDELSYFYRIGVAEAKILQLKLDTEADTIQEVEGLKIKLEMLILKMAQELPRGQAVHDLVQNMRDEIRGTSSTKP